MNNKNKLKVGDKIIYTKSTDGSRIIRQITAVRKTGYSWIYPDKPEIDYWSENSNDQYFEHFWKKLEE